jgi:hypothetical protein
LRKVAFPAFATHDAPAKDSKQDFRWLANESLLRKMTRFQEKSPERTPTAHGGGRWRASGGK